MAQKKRDNNKSDGRDSKKGKFDMNPFNFIEQGKNKLQNFYTKLQKERKISKERSARQRIINEKKELENQKKQAQREKEERIKEEKKQILEQRRLIIENEKQIKKMKKKEKKSKLKGYLLNNKRLKTRKLKK